MDYIDPAFHPSGERPDDVTERAEPIRPAAPPRDENPRAARVRLQLMLAVRELDAEITGLTQECAGLQEEIGKAAKQRERLADLANLEPVVLEHVIAVLKLEGPAGDAYDEHLAEAMRNA